MFLLLAMSHPKIDRFDWFSMHVLPHEKDLRNWLRSRFPSIQDTDDLVQESHSRILAAHDSGPIANPRAFLFITARNLALNQIRHRRYERPEGATEIDPLSIADEVNSPPDSLATKEEFSHLVEAIKSLPKRCRQILTLRKIYGLSQREVAERLGVSVHTVETQGGIGMRKCVEYFRRHGYLN